MTEIICGDALKVLPTLPEKSVDLVFGSPPYEDCRTYGIDFNLKGQDWVDWMVQVYRESLRACRGLVAFVVEGKTRHFRWSATPALLMADLHRAGIHLRKPPAFNRVGIPGSGGPDWLRNDYEFIICATNGGKLPWSDNTAMGHPPKWGPGGKMSNRTADGSRVNFGHAADGTVKGTHARDIPRREVKMVSARNPDETRDDEHGESYLAPVKANPGNVIECIVGGGVMGSRLAHENEAPFPESLAEFFVRSFCPPGGIVLDPFGGSGTTAAVAVKTGRDCITIDCRDSQVALMQRRVTEAAAQQPLLRGALSA